MVDKLENESSPITELKKAIGDAIRSDTVLSDYFSGRVYDRPPPKAKYPHVGMDSSFSVDASAECIDAEEITINIDVWTYSGDDAGVGIKANNTFDGSKVAKRIKRLVLALPEELPSYSIDAVQYRTTRYSEQPDGVTMRTMIAFIIVVTDPD